MTATEVAVTPPVVAVDVIVPSAFLISEPHASNVVSTTCGEIPVAVVVVTVVHCSQTLHDNIAKEKVNRHANK